MNSPSSPMGNSQIGRYGTISLMKQDESNAIITAFGIDSDLTFGRDQNCGVRLYYPDVSPIHCQITFKERKAFLVVLGMQGLLVDGCKVFPSASASSPNIIPLNNNSEIELHGKRFKFTYPPKELRAQLLSTPTLPRRRALRLSMIESAEVFSPRPSTNARENLRVLQSPLKPYFIRSRSSSPHIDTPPRSLFPSTTYSIHTAVDKQDATDEEEIILVEGDSPRVVEEEKDLIILEDVEVPLAAESTSLNPIAHRSTSQSPTKSRYIPAPPPIILPPRPPVTPRRSRPTLHKAVLIRSAQRLVLAELQREEELEEEEEEAEVFGAVLGEEEEEEEEANLVSGNDSETAEIEMEGRDEPTSPTWKASLGRIWPFRRSTSPTKTLLKDEETESSLSENLMDIDTEDITTSEKADNVDATSKGIDVDVKDEDETKPAEEKAPLYPRLDDSLFAPPSRRLFNNPQPQRQAPSKARFSLGTSSNIPSQPRMSLRGGEPHRVKVEEQPWKVQDLVVPTPPSSPLKASDGLNGNKEKTYGVNQLSETERRAIQERRRSALRTPDNFFQGGIPGLTPTKTGGYAPARTGRMSLAANNQDDQLDTRSLLEKMKETVQGMKAERRASLASPQKKLLSETNTGEEEFSLLRSPAKMAVRISPAIIDYEEETLSTLGPAIASQETPIGSDNPGSLTTHGDGDDVQMIDVYGDTQGDLPAVISPPHKTRNNTKKVTRENLVDTPSLADDEASPDAIGRGKDNAESDDEQSSRKPGKILRGNWKSLSSEDSQKSSKPSKTRLAPPSTSSSNVTSETADISVRNPPQDVPLDVDEMVEQPEHAQSLKPQNTTRTRSRSRSKPPSSQSTTIQSEEINEKHGTTPLTLRPSTRKASAEPDTHTTDDEGPAPTKRMRNTRGGRTRGQTTEESDTDSSLKSVSKKPPSRTTRARFKAPASEPEPDDTNDEEVTVTKSTRGRRLKTAIVPEVIKEEEPDELPIVMTGRTRKAVAPSDSSHPSAASGTKGRPKKVVAPGISGEADVNKENAHASASKDEPVVTRTRIGRLRKAATPKIKEEVTTEPETALRTGTRTRVMRKRSKT